MKRRINTKEVEFLDPLKLKCCDCGGEKPDEPNVAYEFKRDCGFCGGQMMSWAWAGWKDNDARTTHWNMLNQRNQRTQERPQP